MRTALPCLIAISTMAENWRSFLSLKPTLPGIDAVFVERLGAGRMIGEQLVADVMEIADEGHEAVLPRELFADMRHGGGGLVAIDRDAHQFRAGAGERGDLRDGRRRCRRCRYWSWTGRRSARRRRPARPPGRSRPERRPSGGAARDRRRALRRSRAREPACHVSCGAVFRRSSGAVVAKNGLGVKSGVALTRRALAGRHKLHYFFRVKQ